MKSQAIFVLGVAGVLFSFLGCGSDLPKQSNALKTYNGQTPVQQEHVEVWTGVAHCSKLNEKFEPDQRQGEKGKTIQWSVCNATIRVECKSELSDQSLRVDSRSVSQNHKTLWNLKICSLNLSGLLESSEPAFSPMSFNLVDNYQAGKSFAQLKIPFAGTNKYVLASLTTPAKWGDSPQVSMALAMEGTSQMGEMVNVALTKNP
jgi:hypothetical protein